MHSAVGELEIGILNNGNIYMFVVNVFFIVFKRMPEEKERIGDWLLDWCFSEIIDKRLIDLTQ